MIVQKGIVFNDSYKDNHSRKHSKDDIINLAKVMVGMSILTQITRAKAKFIPLDKDSGLPHQCQK